MQGFHGCYWRFDLGRNEGERIAIDDSVLQRTLGGVGLGAWLLHREAPVGVDPLAPGIRRDDVAIALFATDFSRWLRGQYLAFLSRLQPGFSAIRKPG